MILHTNLKHIENGEHYGRVLAENKNVMICCGRMGPMCIPVYQSMIEMESSYPDVAFMDFAFDHPEAAILRNLPECQGFMGLPFTVYYRDGKVVTATSGLQSRDQIREILNREYA